MFILITTFYHDGKLKQHRIGASIRFVLACTTRLQQQVQLLLAFIFSEASNLYAVGYNDLCNNGWEGGAFHPKCGSMRLQAFFEFIIIVAGRFTRKCLWAGYLEREAKDAIKRADTTYDFDK